MADERPKPILSDNDFGDWAQYYASGDFYGHFKDELYPFFVHVLRTLPAHSRVLDIAAGPGNLTLEYTRRHSDHPLAWTLLDASREMLRIAGERLASQNLTTHIASFNLDDWDSGPAATVVKNGPFAAIVSTNALFNVRPERLADFYRRCFCLLAPNGWLMNQQSFCWSSLENPHAHSGFPGFAQSMLQDFFPGHPPLTSAQQQDHDEQKKAALARRDAALDAAKANGTAFLPDQSGYHFLTADEHLAYLTQAGFHAGEVWRKREFAVLLAYKPA